MVLLRIGKSNEESLQVNSVGCLFIEGGKWLLVCNSSSSQRLLPVNQSPILLIPSLPTSFYFFFRLDRYGGMYSEIGSLVPTRTMVSPFFISKIGILKNNNIILKNYF